jgi:hypothetical protein
MLSSSLLIIPTASAPRIVATAYRCTLFCSFFSSLHVNTPKFFTMARKFFVGGNFKM